MRSSWLQAERPIELDTAGRGSPHLQITPDLDTRTRLATKRLQVLAGRYADRR
jgi:hypothetical protein